MRQNYDPLRADERSAQNELLRQHGYTWHLEQRVYRDRTHKRWLLLDQRGQEIGVLDALARIEASSKQKGA